MSLNVNVKRLSVKEGITRGTYSLSLHSEIRQDEGGRMALIKVVESARSIFCSPQFEKEYLCGDYKVLHIGDITADEFFKDGCYVYCVSVNADVRKNDTVVLGSNADTELTNGEKAV